MVNKVLPRKLNHLKVNRNPYTESYKEDMKKICEQAAEKIYAMSESELMEEIRWLLWESFHKHENIMSDRDPITEVMQEYKL